MPNRILKESVCTSDTIDGLSWFEEVLFYRLIVNCDDFGRFDGRVAVIKNRLFPLKENLTLKTVSEAINRLASAGLVALYEFEGKPYLHLPTWNEHQNVRAKRSKYPAPEDAVNTSEYICNHVQSSESICSRNPIQSNPNPNPNPNTNTESESAPAYDPAVAAVMTAYLNKINPSASQRSLDELSGYVEAMGKEVCLRAIDIALDAKKANWPYIRGILRRLQSQGVTCLADWDAQEQQREHVQDQQGNGEHAVFSPGSSELAAIRQMKAKHEEERMKKDNAPGKE